MQEYFAMINPVISLSNILELQWTVMIPVMFLLAGLTYNAIRSMRNSNIVMACIDILLFVFILLLLSWFGRDMEIAVNDILENTGYKFGYLINSL